ncbi:MAG: hypothetical protein ACTHW2_08080 [Tissierella sp.]|uniref:hypothetical protein n=1 Tax=Tissierella sp. TaxID=41274 RepID=UPI003F9D9BE6
MKMDKEFYTIKDIQKLFNMSYPTALKVVKSIDKKRMIGGKWIITKETLKNFIDGEDN